MTELKDKNGNIIREPNTCKYCGQIYDASLKFALELEDNQCFNCWFWLDLKKYDTTNPDRVVIVGGAHYRYSDDVKDRSCAGFAGQKFHIQFNDGREVITHNLWYQGKIPKWIRRQFPDNAVFINKENNNVSI